MNRTARAVAILFMAVATGMASWVVLPKHAFAGGTTADAANRPFLSPNNAWSVVRQLSSGNPAKEGRVHVVWTTHDLVGTDSVSKVFYRYTDDLGKSWSDSAPISRSDPTSDSAYDPALAVIGDYVAVAWYEDCTENEEKGRRILLRSSTDAGGSWRETALDLIDPDEPQPHFHARHPSLTASYDETDGPDYWANAVFSDSCQESSHGVGLYAERTRVGLDITPPVWYKKQTQRHAREVHNRVRVEEDRRKNEE